MDIETLYRDYGVDYRTEGHKHSREGWVNCECVWCTTDNPGYHLGYNVANDFFTCWKCGWHPIVPTISRLLHVNEFEAQKILQDYGMMTTRQTFKSITKSFREHKLPSDVGPLGENHRAYLKRRLFDPDYLEQEWNIVGSGPISKLDTLSYKHRIIIPFIWDGEQVSFDSRDITDRHIAKYMACPADRERIPHKDILYGKQEYWKETGICVEGPTDVWRFGANSFATSGIKYTQKQMRLMATLFKRVAVCFDGQEAQALNQARALVGDLKFRGIDSWVVHITGDPGSMCQLEADALVSKLMNF